MKGIRQYSSCFVSCQKETRLGRLISFKNTQKGFVNLRDAGMEVAMLNTEVWKVIQEDFLSKESHISESLSSSHCSIKLWLLAPSGRSMRNWSSV